jgi:hypothetical protein
MKNTDFIPVIENLEEKAHDFMSFLQANHRGRKNSIMARYLKNFGTKDREIRKLVHLLRVQGYPIGSYSKGYYYATTTDEIHDTLNFIVNGHKMEAYEGLKDCLRKLA